VSCVISKDAEWACIGPTMGLGSVSKLSGHCLFVGDIVHLLVLQRSNARGAG
jgi:hypothetical protein